MRLLQAALARQLTLDELLRPEPGLNPWALDTGFPEALANQLATAEAFNKHLFRPNTYLHKWWARRCGSTFRAILKQFVADPSRRDYYAPGGLEGKVVLDPMMGGGTTLHEAIRLGASVIGADIDPIPVVQARASLSRVALPDLQAAFDHFLRDLYGLIGAYFQTECPICAKTVDSQYTLYGLRKRCACGEVVQLEQYALRHENNTTIAFDPRTGDIKNSRLTEDAPGNSKPDGLSERRRLITKNETVCPTCGQKYQDLLDVAFYARYAPVAIAGVCPDHDLFFRSPAQADLRRIEQANALRSQLDFSPVEDFAVPDGPKSGDLLARRVFSYLDVFSSRQLLYLFHAIDLLQTYDGAVKLNLALLVSTSLEFNAMLCGYKGWFKQRPGAIRHVFGLHAYVFQYTAAENNPVNRGRSSGNLRRLFQDRIARGRTWARLPIERKPNPNGGLDTVPIHGEVDEGVEVGDQPALATTRQAFWLIHGDSRRLSVADHSVDIVVTDPPYYDSVQYSDLAVFFRVWLARLLPDEIDWQYDISRSAVASASTSGDSNFMTVLGGIFQECARVLKPGCGRLVFTFHHWDPNAWAELTIALKQAHFRLDSAHVVFSENPISAHIMNLKALKHDVIMNLALAENQAPRPWEPVTQVDSSESEIFCRQCGATLGWLLQTDLSSAQIRTVWRQLVPGRRMGAMRNNPGLPDKDRFVQALNAKLQARLAAGLR